MYRLIAGESADNSFFAAGRLEMHLLSPQANKVHYSSQRGHSEGTGVRLCTDRRKTDLTDQCLDQPSGSLSLGYRCHRDLALRG